MINDILDFSLISKGRLRLKFESTNIKELINEIVSIMILQARLKGLSLEIENLLIGDENYLVDCNRLKQVLLNLIGNAIKFTPRGQVKVRIHEDNIQERASLTNKSNILRQDQMIEFDEILYQQQNPPQFEQRSIMSSSMNLDRKRIIFEVEDTGIGIKPEDIGRLFTLFSRVTHGHDKNMNGIGLGLAISQSLVELMNSHRTGASIKVISEVGKGSKFYFPIYIDNEPSKNFREAEENSIQRPFFYDAKPQKLSLLDNLSMRLDSEGDSLIIEKSKKKKILVVDDDPINLLVASSYLEYMNNEFTFVKAENGKEALDKLEHFAQNNEYFDIILMDCNMPILDGYEASQIIKSMMKENVIPWAPIVAITANIAVTDKEKCYKSGMDLFLTKPYMKTQLLKTLEEALLFKKGLPIK